MKKENSMNTKMLNTSQRCKYQNRMEINSYQHDFLVRNFVTQVLITLLNENDWSSQGKIAAEFETSLVLWTSPTAYTENHPVKSAFKNIVLLRFSPPGYLVWMWDTLHHHCFKYAKWKTWNQFPKKNSYFQRKISPKQ